MCEDNTLIGQSTSSGPSGLKEGLFPEPWTLDPSRNLLPGLPTKGSVLNSSFGGDFRFVFYVVF